MLYICRITKQKQNIMATYGLTKQEVTKLLKRWKNLSHSKKVAMTKKAYADYPRTKSVSQCKKWRKEHPYTTVTV